MFTHVRVASSDLEKSAAFYNATLGALGILPGMMLPSAVLYQHEGNRFIAGTPLAGEPGDANGLTIGFAAKSQAQVDAFHAAALENGGICEGEPGPRQGPGNRYAAYVRDPDGNKLSAAFFG